ncbi:glycoside hydrolase family 47 protein [Candidatus Bathyarchaeota archaeon]|nr:glycoside hydrolase family 47 protein [Candidatus Bathyarchaeota archaeon]
MKVSTTWLSLTALASVATAAVADAAKMNAVEEVFRRTWKGYREHAWGHDSLKPVSNGYTDDRYGWPRGSDARGRREALSRSC